MPLAYGYIRFSSDKQEHGDSVRRQQDGIATWLARNASRVQLDVSLADEGIFIDRGKTGFAPTGAARKNLDEDYALGQFKKLVRSGRIQAGSYLVVESADRLSRESPVVALHLLTELLMLGVVVVTLSPEMEYRTDSDIGKLITAGVTIGRAHDESQIKHRRNAWPVKRANAGNQPLTSLIPGWCKLVGAKRIGTRLVGGEIKPDAAKAATVRRIYELILAGHGCKRIAEKFNAERIPVLGRGKNWTESAVYGFATSRAVIGEYHPHTGQQGSRPKGKAHTRRPTGVVVKGYYPVIVTPDRFALVQDELSRRFRFKGRRGHHVNLFAGLLRDGRDGGPYGYRHSQTHPVTLIPIRAKDGSGSNWTSFNATIFEDCVLRELAELKAADIFPEHDCSGAVSALAAQHAAKEAELREFEREIDDNPALLKRFKDTLLRLESECASLASQLAAAQREAASPLAEVWGEVRNLTDLVRSGGDDIRQRCRNAIRRALDSVTCVFAGGKMERLAAVRVQFRSGLHRDYLIGYLPRNKQRKSPPPPVICTPPQAWTETHGELDLRDPAHAAVVERLLSSLDIETLMMPVATASTEPREPEQASGGARAIARKHATVTHKAKVRR